MGAEVIEVKNAVIVGADIIILQKMIPASNRNEKIKAKNSHNFIRQNNIDENKSMLEPVAIMADEKSNIINLASKDFIINLKTGIIRDLYSRQLITQKQMDTAIIKLKQGVNAKC